MMSPNTTTIERRLRAVTKEIYNSGKEDNLTVRFIRDRVQNDLKLLEGFFLSEEWKTKSKSLIKEYVSQLSEETEGADEATQESITPRIPTPVKKGSKRAAPEPKPQPKKRQKKEATPSDEEEDEPVEESEEESVLSEFNDSDESAAPKAKTKQRPKPMGKAPVKRQRNNKAIAESDESEEESSEASASDEDGDASPPPKKKASPKQTVKAAASAKRNSKESIESESEEVEEEKVRKDESEDQETEKRGEAVGSDSEMSVVLDEVSKPKHQRKPKSTASKPIKSKAPTTTKAELSPSEAQIKTLQSQLLKCGVRKLWGVLLKPYGDDNKAKIKHLEGMLRDIGMVGRFSEQRAREIKELRELQADLEEVTKGEKAWGMESGRRARGQRKSLKEETHDDEDEDEDEDGEVDEQGGTDRSASLGPRERRAARAQQELAFLGDDDDDESDSD